MTPTREEVIRVARECGMHRQVHNLMSNPMQQRFSYDCWEDQLERLAMHFYEAGERDANIPHLVDALEQIQHSIKQAQIVGNDWRRELALIDNTIQILMDFVK